MSSANAERWREYLLGLLSDEEAERVEQAYFGDDGTFEALLQAEDELIDDYLEGRLSEGEQRAFEACLAERPELGARVVSRRTLLETLERRARAVPERAADPPRHVGWRRSFLGLAAVAAAVFVTVRAWQEDKAPPLRTAKAPAEAQLQAPASEPAASPLILLLGAGGVRGAGKGVPTATLDAQTSAVILKLPRSGTAVRAAVEDVDGGVVWTGAPREADGVWEVELPAAGLRAGDYILRVRLSSAGVDEAFFRVRR